MQIVSVSKSPILSDFASLKTLYHEHKEEKMEAMNFNFFAESKIFVEVANKMQCANFYQVTHKSDDSYKLSLVRRINCPKVFCVGCPKIVNDEMALGYVTGNVKVLNVKTMETVHKFTAESTKKSVLHIDFNSSHEYISAVYEPGIINVYSMKTKVKIDSIALDSNSILTRFHPTKKYQLSVASYKGTVSIYDVQSKRKIFQLLNCHKAPCKDLCHSVALPDCLISVGYDCLINVFDTRKKTQPMALKYAHPLSSVALSECGNYFCVGNLKGEVISYDLRNPKSYLNSQKIHTSAINRISFVPSNSASSHEPRTSLPKCEEKPQPAENEDFKSRDVRESFANIENFHRRDSFFDFLDNNQKDNELPASSSKFRESFDWDSLGRQEDGRGSGADRVSTRLSDRNVTDRQNRVSFKEGKENIPGEENTQRRMSKVQDAPSVCRLKNISEEKEESEEVGKSERFKMPEKLPFKQQVNSTRRSYDMKAKPVEKTASAGNILDGKTSTPHTRRSSDAKMTAPMNISTIAKTRKDCPKEFVKPAPPLAKGRPQARLEIDETPRTIPSATHPKKFNVDKTAEITQASPDSVIEPSFDETLKERVFGMSTISPLVSHQSRTLSQESPVAAQNHQPLTLEDMIVELRAEMNEKIHDLRQEMLFTAEENKMKIIMQTVRSNIPQNKMLEDILVNLDLLNQTDHFVTAFYNMAEENQRLKDEIAALKSNK
ncbi:NEDD1 family protein [Megaselia abdita]